MRLRKQDLGDRNLIGHRVESVRKQKGMKQKELLAQLQVSGVDMNASGLSKLEGQIRFVTDVELVALADILEVSGYYLLGRDEKIKNSCCLIGFIILFPTIKTGDFTKVRSPVRFVRLFVK